MHNIKILRRCSNFSTIMSLTAKDNMSNANDIQENETIDLPRGIFKCKKNAVKKPSPVSSVA